MIYTSDNKLLVIESCGGFGERETIESLEGVRVLLSMCGHLLDSFVTLCTSVFRLICYSCLVLFLLTRSPFCGFSLFIMLVYFFILLNERVFLFSFFFLIEKELLVTARTSLIWSYLLDSFSFVISVSYGCLSSDLYGTYVFTSEISPIKVVDGWKLASLDIYFELNNPWILHSKSTRLLRSSLTWKMRWFAQTVFLPTELLPCFIQISLGFFGSKGGPSIIEKHWNLRIRWMPNPL